MISILWLLLIVPASVLAGLILAGLLAAGRQADDCAACQAATRAAGNTWPGKIE